MEESVSFSWYRKFLETKEQDTNLFVHVFDHQQHRAVHLSHVPVQSLQAAPMDGCAVDQLPLITPGPCWHVNSKLFDKELLIRSCPDKTNASLHLKSTLFFCLTVYNLHKKLYGLSTTSRQCCRLCHK